MKDFFSSRITTISDYIQSQRFPTTDWNNIFHWNYWTQNYLPPTTVYSLFTIIVIIIICIGLSIWRTVLKKKHANTPVYDAPLDQLSNIIFFIIITMVAYAFFRYQSVSYLSNRLVILAIAIVTIVWIGVVTWQLWKKIPSQRIAYLEKERFFRYLPKRPQESEKNNI